LEKKTAVVYPGQGSQKPGMAKDFYDQYPAAKQVFEEASEAIGEDMMALCFNEDPRLNLTEFTQPAIVTAEIAMTRILNQEFGLKAEIFAGHSLGEYSALVAADVIGLGDAVRIVRKRGALMQAAVPAGVGSMAAVVLENIESCDYRSLVKECGAEVANFNSLDQVVISGKTESVIKASEKIAEAYKDKGVNVVPLEVSAPFHSSLMSVIEPEFKAFLNQFSSGFNLPNAAKVVSNFTSEFHTPASLIDNLTSQISGSVRWIENMKLIASHSNQIFEVGPNRPLGKFFKTVGVDIVSVINLKSAEKAFRQ
jgi:malonyl CoA-acyl carrier protein transacylase